MIFKNTEWLPEIFVDATLDSVITKSQIDIVFSSKSHVILQGKSHETVKASNNNFTITAKFLGRLLANLYHQ